MAARDQTLEQQNADLAAELELRTAELERFRESVKERDAEWERAWRSVDLSARAAAAHDRPPLA